MKRGMVLILAFCMAFMIGGCGEKMPEITSEQNKKITEFLGGLLMKYDKNHESRLLSDRELTSELERLENLNERKQMIKQEDLKEEPGKEDGELQKDSKEKEKNEFPEETAVYAEDFYGLDGVTVRYKGYTVGEQYPADGEQLYFMMKANEGKKLLVIDFTVSNNSEEEKNLDMISLNPEFLIGINDGAPKRSLMTLLTNDLSSFKGVIPAGSSQNLVLVVEVSDELGDRIENVSVIMKNESGSEKMNLN